MEVHPGRGLDDLIGELVRHLIWRISAGMLGRVGGPDLGVGRVQSLAGESVRRCWDGSGLEVTELALEESWRNAVHTLARLVPISVGRDAWRG